MSDTESFEYAIKVMRENLAGMYANGHMTKYGDIDTSVDLDQIEDAHNREIRDVSQQQYDRGYHDGQHSMDAEHRAIAMRLRGLRFDGGSHENLSRIAYAIYPCATGWTCESAAGLRDKLVDLMGGVSEPSVADVAKELMDTIIKESNERLQNDGKAEKPSITEVSDDTCDCAGGGACADCDCDDSGEQEEVTDERLADDCAVDSRGGDGGGDLHMAGLEPTVTVTDDGLTITSEDGNELRIVKDDILLNGKSIVKESIDGFLGLTTTYDVLDNERRKAVCELRSISVDELCKKYDYVDVYPEFIWSIGQAIGLRHGAGFEEIISRLIHILGGDQPSGIDVLREMDAESDTNGTCPNDVQMASITDELREYNNKQIKWLDSSKVHYRKLFAIADRIDEQFDRICQQHEAVLQESIAEVVKEYEHDRLPDQLRIEKLERQRDEARDERDELMKQRAEMTAELARRLKERDKLRAECNGLRAGRDELRAMIAKIREAIDG